MVIRRRSTEMRNKIEGIQIMETKYYATCRTQISRRKLVFFSYHHFGTSLLYRQSTSPDIFSPTEFDKILLPSFYKTYFLFSENNTNSIHFYRITYKNIDKSAFVFKILKIKMNFIMQFRSSLTRNVIAQ